MPLQQTLPDPLRSSRIFYLFTQSSFQFPHCPPPLSCYSALRVLQVLCLQMVLWFCIPSFIHSHHDFNSVTEWCRSMKAYRPFFCKGTWRNANFEIQVILWSSPEGLNWSWDFSWKRIFSCLLLLPALPLHFLPMLSYLCFVSASEEPHLRQPQPFNWAFSAVQSH